MEANLGKPEGEIGELVEQFYNSPLFQHMQGLANQSSDEMIAAERVKAMQGRSAAEVLCEHQVVRDGMYVQGSAVLPELKAYQTECRRRHS